MKSIREIAELSGVSIATVSRYVNNKGYIQDDTGNKIQKIIDKYGYKPNKLATAVFKGSINDIGLVVQDINNPFFAQLMSEIEIKMQKKGYNLIICNAHGKREAELKYYDDLISKRVAGLLIINTNDENIYKDCSIPIVGIEKRILDYPKIKANNNVGMEKILEKIDDLSSKRILYVSSKKSNYAAKERLKIVEKFSKEKNFKFSLFFVNDNYKDLGNLDINLADYDLVMCWNDIVAHAIYSKAIHSGLEVPKDLEITGFDGLDLNLILPYQLTTVRQNITKLGEKSFELLIKMINKEEVDDVVIDIDFIVGETIKI